jgi:hypothetical protein
MNTNILATAAALSDQDLLARLATLAQKERQASVELVAHLAALDTRPAVYAAQGYGSLHAYCTQALLLSEDAASSRIAAARACRRFPVILDLLGSGALSLTSVRLLGGHLTPENYQGVLERAVGRGRHAIEVLVAELSPRPDVPSSVRKLPTPTPSSPPSTAATMASRTAPSDPPPTIAPPPAPFVASRRSIVQATAPQRYRVQFSIGEATHEKLRRLQALLRREIPDGDPGAIFDRAVTLLLEKVEKTKLGRTDKPRPRLIRPWTDKDEDIRTPGPPSRTMPRAIRRAAWQQDGGQCAFVSATGRRCTERTFLEFHHIRPFAKGGPATAANVSLRCRLHNRHEAELIFGPYRTTIVSESASVSPERPLEMKHLQP